jgi:transcriptional regulator with XRE-family HTH domain
MATTEVIAMPTRQRQPATDTALALGEMLERTRTQRWLTQEQCVEQIGCSLSTYQRILAGRPVSAHTIRIVAHWLPYSDSEIREAAERLRGNYRRPPTTDLKLT